MWRSKIQKRNPSAFNEDELTQDVVTTDESNRRPRGLIHSIPWFFMISLTLMFFAFNLRASSASKLLTGAAWPFSPAAAAAEAEAGAAAEAAKVAVTATSAGGAGGAGAGPGSAARSD